MSESITVYSFHRCPFAIRVRMTLHEKSLPFTIVEEDLKNFSPELRKLHPEAKVPVLVHGSRVIYESAIITEYLNEQFPKPALMPRSADLRAEVRLWTHYCNHLFKPDVDRLKYGTSRFSEIECAGVEAKVVAHLQKMEATLANARYLVGDTFSLADIHVFPFVRQLMQIKPEPAFLGEFPGLLKWAERIKNRPSFSATMER